MPRARVSGKQIYLRPLERSDLTEEYLDWINDPAVNTHILASGFPVNRDSLESYYENSQPPECAMFAICDLKNDRHMGNARLSRIDWIHRSALYGRMIGPAEYRGKGYGSDALVQLLRYAFHHLGLNRIWSVAVIQNEISLGSNDKIGMTREGIMKQYFFINGQYVDGVALSMLREDFDRIHGDPAYWEEQN
jgi:[ribosomal protein S5]-alanine N-acetyltransferase